MRLEEDMSAFSDMLVNYISDDGSSDPMAELLKLYGLLLMSQKDSMRTEALVFLKAILGWGSCSGSSPWRIKKMALYERQGKAGEIGSYCIAAFFAEDLGMDRKMVALYERAEAEGSGIAGMQLGAHYLDLPGPKNACMAYEHYLNAARAGNSIAQHKLGYLLEHGTGVQRNVDEAMSWYYEAMLNGNGDSCNNLATILEDRGLECYRNETVEGLYAKGYKLGSSYAKKSFARLHAIDKDPAILALVYNGLWEAFVADDSPQVASLLGMFMVPYAGHHNPYSDLGLAKYFLLVARDQEGDQTSAGFLLRLGGAEMISPETERKYRELSAAALRRNAESSIERITMALTRHIMAPQPHQKQRCPGSTGGKGEATTEAAGSLCSACHERKPKSDFTKSQLKLGGGKRKCRACVEENAALLQ